MLDVWGLRVIICHIRGGPLGNLILFEGGGVVLKKFLQMFQVFGYPPPGLARSRGGRGGSSFAGLPPSR